MKLKISYTFYGIIKKESVPLFENLFIKVKYSNYNTHYIHFLGLYL